MVVKDNWYLQYVRDMATGKVCRVHRPVYDGYEIILDNKIVFRKIDQLYNV